MLEADPNLSSVIGWRATAEVGHKRILPVLSVPSGPWQPPDPEALGGETVAFVVLDGLLVADTTPDIILGPGDIVVPWEPGVRWTACTPLRLALLGTQFTEGLRAWPHAAGRVLARAQSHTAHAAPGVAEERLLDLLWQIAARWGVPHGDGVELPRALDVGPLSALLQLPEADVTAGVGRLASLGTLVRDRSGWLLRTGRSTGLSSGHSRERRDHLRARGAQQLALARAVGAEFAAVSREVQRTRASRR